MNNSEILSNILCIVFPLVMIGFVFLFVDVKKKQDVASKALRSLILKNLPADKQAIFFMQYNASCKNITVALLLNFFLGGVGAHKFYLNKTTEGFIYLLLSWTLLPAVVAFFELFLESYYVRKYNEDVAKNTYIMLTGNDISMLK